MLRAVVEDGVLRPLEPLPGDWREGTELWIEVAIPHKGTPEFPALEDSEGISDEDYEILETALERADADARDAMRREMGLT